MLLLRPLISRMYTTSSSILPLSNQSSIYSPCVNQSLHGSLANVSQSVASFSAITAPLVEFLGAQMCSRRSKSCQVDCVVTSDEEGN